MVDSEREVGETVAGPKAGAGGFESGALHGVAIEVANHAEDDSAFSRDHCGGLADPAFVVTLRCFEGVYIESAEVGGGVELGMMGWSEKHEVGGVVGILTGEQILMAR